jgi:hypothetical protein
MEVLCHVQRSPRKSGSQFSYRHNETGNLGDFWETLAGCIIARPSDIQEGLAAGADDYLGTPLKSEDLRQRLKTGRRYNPHGQKGINASCTLPID